MPTGKSKKALWAGGRDVPIEIDQRALIDKILARYSGEFTVFRELLQNSDDAKSQAAEIHFETEAKNVDDAGLQAKLVHQWRFMNNGRPFEEGDWRRLRKIAEGSPDVEKIGAFGVGFYSLFSVTEEPFVTSGGKWMGFYWKDGKDQLFVRQGDIPSEQVEDVWTSFDMKLRKPTPIPPIINLCRFLASSITFMSHLREISVHLDNQHLFKVIKSADSAIPLAIPMGFACTSPKDIMHVNGLESTRMHITARVSPRLCTPLPRATVALNQASISPVHPSTLQSTIQSTFTLSVFSASVGVTLDEKLAAELRRSLKKDAPPSFQYSFIFTSKDDYDASIAEEKRLPDALRSVFDGLRADVDGVGSAYVSIGHRTSQTTGLGGHMAARFIPTVERESIDFVDRNVSVWNREMLYVGGFLARSVYELEMEKIAKQWKPASSDAMSPDSNVQAHLYATSRYLLNFFSFYRSTPSADVSDIMKSAFFSCRPTHPPSFISTIGIRDASIIRIPDKKLEFLKGLCVIPRTILTDVRPEVFNNFREHDSRFLRQVQFDDIAAEFRARPLDRNGIVSWMKWWKGEIEDYKTRKDPLIDPRTSARYTQLWDSAKLLANSSHGGSQTVIQMSSITMFLHEGASKGAAHIPADGPLPDNVLPYDISKEFSSDFLHDTCRLKELGVVDWLRFLIDQVPQKDPSFDLTEVPSWAEVVLVVLSRAWISLDRGMRDAVKRMLKNTPCIPTSDGLRVPADSYFASTDATIHNLPLVTFRTGPQLEGALQELLVELGVQTYLPIELVYERMVVTGSWGTPEFVEYLVKIKTTFKSEQWQYLKQNCLFTAHSATHTIRLNASQLYEPSTALRELGLPVLKWGPPMVWSSQSDSAALLYDIGLHRCPKLEVLIKLCASADDIAIRRSALNYLLDNMDTHYSHTAPTDVAMEDIYLPSKFSHVKFVPATRKGQDCLASPIQVYCASQWGALGFTIAALSPESAAKLQLAMHPPTKELVALLISGPPRDETEAREWFSLIGGRVKYFSSMELETLSRTAFVPISPEPPIRHETPARCFLGDKEAQPHYKFFSFVDFGQHGNAFLAACGSKQRPSVDQVVHELLSDPLSFYNALETPERFLMALSSIARGRESLSITTFKRMKKEPILLGLKRRREISKESEGGKSDNLRIWEHSLLRGDQVIVADDPHSYELFWEDFFAAPQQDELETFYLSLGATKLSALINYRYSHGQELDGHKYCTTIRSLILDRLSLFLHNAGHTLDVESRHRCRWLGAENNLRIQVFDDLMLTISLSHPRLSRSYPPSRVSAVAHRDNPTDPLQLWLVPASGAPLDYYDIAISLCRHIFVRPKSKHALLLVGLLSSERQDLMRLGYDVDHSVKRQNEMADEADTSFHWHSRPPPNMPRSKVTDLVSSSALPTNSSTPDITLPTHCKTNADLGTSGEDSSQLCTTAEGPSPKCSPCPTRVNIPASRSIIDNNISKAIRECKPNTERSDSESTQDDADVESSSNRGYEILESVRGLQYLETVEDVNLYISLGLDSSVLANKRDVILRFIRLIKPLRSLYGLRPQSVHIFYSTSEQLAVWNTQGGVFLNLHSFEAWHDEQIRHGKLKRAYVSWYFALARGITHSLVYLPSTEHEFYFSAISQRYLLKLGDLLSGLPSERTEP